MSNIERPIRVLTVDDHPLLREGIAGVIGGQPDMQLVCEATNGREAVHRFREYLPDVTLMDLQMPEMNGIDAIQAIRAEFVGARIVVLTLHRGDMQALSALRAGACGYLLKSMLRKELVETIRAVHAGRRRIPPEIAAELAEHVTDDALTAREVEILKRAACGNANKMIASQLGISEDTVKAHMKSILAKLNANDRTHAVTVALRRGIIEL